MLKPKILVVDDEPDVAEVLGYKLEESGYRPLFAADGEAALRLVREEKPALIVLDVMMPQLDGLEVCRILRRDPAHATLPIIMLTARAAETDRIVGLEIGADDYVTKPFSPRELVLRIKKVLERTTATDMGELKLTLGPLEIDTSRHEVRVAGEPVVLTATEFRLLELLIRRRGRVQTRDGLLADVWGYEGTIESRTVDTHMRRLREKLGPAAERLETIRGVGYRFTA